MEDRSLMQVHPHDAGGNIIADDLLFSRVLRLQKNFSDVDITDDNVPLQRKYKPQLFRIVIKSRKVGGILIIEVFRFSDFMKFPNLNSHCLGDAMRIFKSVNLGCAVDTERGLMVPAIPHADDLNITGLSKQLKKIADDAKKGCVNPDLLSPEAASFTVSNLGGFGVEWFTPIINVPQSAILGVGTIVPRPKDLGGGVYAFVPYMQLSLTYDHRAVDGGEATRFLKQVATEIENLEVEF